jgi:hypothetical protein
MKDRSFSLIPFPSSGLLPPVTITGTISRRSNILSIGYALLCPPAALAIPAPADVPARRNGLWEETCFELFLGVKNSDHYWEVNLSPSGHWNVYRFTSYRQGMEEEPAFASLPFDVHMHPDTLRLSLELNLDEIIQAGQALQVGVSAVIKTIDGRITYWALTHPGPQADFHRRDSFVVEL